MKSEEDQRLFPCINHHIEYPGLRGVSFEVLKSTSSLDALCAWVGGSCSFNQLISFMSEQAKDGYRFTTLTPMLETPERRKISRLSTPFYEGHLVIVGRIDGARHLGPLDQLLRPFRLSAWGVVLLTSVLLLLLSLRIVYSLHGPIDNPLRALGLCCHLIFHPHIEIPRVREQTASQKYYLAVSLLKSAGLMFIAVTLLFYEAGVVNYLFKKPSPELPKALPTLSTTELRTFSVEKDQAVENIFRDLVYADRRSSLGLYPWYRCSTKDECWEKLLDSTDELNYYVTFTAEAEYMAKKRGSWSKVASFEPETKLYSLQTGFLHNYAVPEAWVMKLDVELLRLRRFNVIKKRIRQEAGPPLQAKGDASNDIDGVVVMIPIIAFVLPFMVYVFCGLFICSGPPECTETVQA